MQKKLFSNKIDVSPLRAALIASYPSPYNAGKINIRIPKPVAPAANLNHGDFIFLNLLSTLKYTYMKYADINPTKSPKPM